MHLKKYLPWMVIGLVVCEWGMPAAGAESVSPKPPLDAIAPPTPAWQTRETVEHANAVAESFMNSLLIADPDAKSAFLVRRPGFSEVISAYQKKSYTEGEAAFYDYFLAKIHDISKYGIDPGRLSSFVGTYATGLKPEDVLPVADKLMANTMSLGHKDVVIGEPGAVNWNYPFGPDETVPWDQEVDPNLSSGCGLIPLVAAYIQTHNEKYIKKWVAYMDDWAINSHYVSRVHPLMEPDSVYNQGNEEPIDLAVILLALETVSPENGKSATSVLPPRIFAEIINKYLGELQLPGIMYVRSNTHNWTPRWQRVLTGFLFDEFKMGQICLREAIRRQVEDNAVTQNLRDGSENQQDQWYNFVYGASISEVLRIVERRHDAGLWTDPNFYRWESEMRAYLKNRVTYEIHMRTPENTWPTVLAATDKRQAYLPPLAVSPEAFSDPTNFAILQATQHPESGVRPAYTSDWFPYGGYNIVRTSWEKDSSTGSLFCSPQPGAYGGYRSRSNNNMFGLEAWGQDLFIDDATGHYMYPSGPITVDGHEQFFHAGLYKVGKPSAHKVYEVSAWTEPADWRWHSSESFNLMEGIYKGPYADPPDSPSIIGPYGVDQSQGNTRALAGTIQDVTHQRLVLYMHGANLWIITDRMLTQASHQYVQKWQIPITPAAHTAFDPGEVKFDGQLHTITTDGPKKVNFSMYQFTNSSLQYSNKVVENKPAPSGRVFGYGRLEAQIHFGGEGNQQIITALLPRPVGVGTEGGLRDVKQITSGDKGVGFVAMAPDGSEIKYLASTLSEGDDLVLDSLSARAGLLAVNGSHGFVLDCKSLSMGGVAIPISSKDFEFEINNDRIENIVPVYRPIAPVEIGPEENAFVDHLDVTLSTATPGVEIHYTVDGSDPTPQSQIYTGPFTIRASSIIKARAYRPGERVNPVELSGTHATTASTAVFDKTELIEPSTDAKLVAGVKYRYWEGDWQDLWLNLDTKAPAKTGTCGRLWDLSIIPPENPPIFDGKAAPRANCYAIEYSGFLNVPSDGTYTIHAPREFIYPDVQSGYELRVFLGKSSDSAGLLEWYPSTRLHAFGDWSVSLKSGSQPFRIVWIDMRTDAAKKLNFPGIKDYVWTGETPDLQISGPGVQCQQIPNTWLECPPN